MKPHETERLRLRRFAEHDLEPFLAYRQDPEVARYQGWSDYTRPEAEAFVANQVAQPFGVDESWFQVAVARRSDDALLGDCGLHFLGGRQLEIGFTLARAHQGQGYMSEALRALLELAFRELQIHRVTALTDTRNAASVSLLERLGFRREGHYRENVWFKGAWGDEYLYALLAEEAKADRAVETSGAAEARAYGGEEPSGAKVDRRVEP